MRAGLLRQNRSFKFFETAVIKRDPETALWKAILSISVIELTKKRKRVSIIIRHKVDLFTKSNRNKQQSKRQNN